MCYQTAALASPDLSLGILQPDHPPPQRGAQMEAYTCGGYITGEKH